MTWSSRRDLIALTQGRFGAAAVVSTRSSWSPLTLTLFDLNAGLPLTPPLRFGSPIIASVFVEADTALQILHEDGRVERLPLLSGDLPTRDWMAWVGPALTGLHVQVDPVTHQETLVPTGADLGLARDALYDALAADPTQPVAARLLEHLRLLGVRSN